MAIGGAMRAVGGNAPAVSGGDRSRCAQRLRSRALLGWKTRRKMSQAAVEVTYPLELRHAETRILAEQPRPATATVRTSRQGRVLIRRLVESSIGLFRQRAQRLREARYLERSRGVGRRGQDQEQPGTIRLVA